MQTQTSNTLHNAIMEAGGKDRLPMLAPNPPYKYTWEDKEVPVAEGSSVTTTERYMENYKNVLQDIRDQLNAKAKAIQIILTGIDNDIYSTVDACPNACEMWKAIERLKQGESINVQDLETNLYWEFGKFTSRDGESLESYYLRFYKMMNELVRNQCKEIDKLMALISLSFKKIYKPTNNNLRTSSNTSRVNQDNSPRINRGTGYDNQRICNIVRARETIDAADNSGPIFDAELFQKLAEIILFIFDSGCSKHMTGNLKLLTNFVEKFLGTVKFRNDQIAPILGYGDLVQGAVTIKRVYYVKGLNHNLFSVDQFCDAGLEVAFWKSTCYICDLKGNDLLTGSRGTDLYSIILQDTSSPNLIYLMAKATSSQAWLWHRRLSHLNFNTIN
uniref:Integrase, catalytic region, zinc finger, CCHC-type, peptidase aspartic, catalytic n=1 Tax=Tanacetum cinerariifolium TaxID=118510 RepID=A0A699ISG0_TANCI|nr:integrase, catalytic region, zinc finger, CCHC-type, peptidase aspartic, catalytic [Tanacetum cinerariifolium]